MDGKQKRTIASPTTTVAAAAVFITDSFSTICAACHISIGHVALKHIAYDAHFVDIIIIYYHY